MTLTEEQRKYLELLCPMFPTRADIVARDARVTALINVLDIRLEKLFKAFKELNGKIEDMR